MGGSCRGEVKGRRELEGLFWSHDQPDPKNGIQMLFMPEGECRPGTEGREWPSLGASHTQWAFRGEPVPEAKLDLLSGIFSSLTDCELAACLP